MCGQRRSPRTARDCMTRSRSYRVENSHLRRGFTYSTKPYRVNTSGSYLRQRVRIKFIGEWNSLLTTHRDLSFGKKKRNGFKDMTLIGKNILWGNIHLRNGHLFIAYRRKHRRNICRYKRHHRKVKKKLGSSMHRQTRPSSSPNPFLGEHLRHPCGNC